MFTAERKRLAAKLRTYGTRAARHAHYLVLDRNVDKLLIHLELVAPEKLLYRYVAKRKRRDLHTAGVRVRHGRHDLYRQIGRLATRVNVFKLGFGNLAYRNDYDFRRSLGDYRFEIVYAALDLDAVHLHILLFRVVVEYGYGQIPLVGVVDKAVYDKRARIPRSDNYRTFEVIGVSLA